MVCYRVLDKGSEKYVKTKIALYGVKKITYNWRFFGKKI